MNARPDKLESLEKLMRLLFTASEEADAVEPGECGARCVFIFGAS